MFSLFFHTFEASRRKAAIQSTALPAQPTQTTTIHKGGGHAPESTISTGVYASEYANPEILSEVQTLSDTFLTETGRRPRILVAKLGQDGHDRGARVIASAFADMGFDVDVGPLFQTASETALQAMENDVHIVGVSSLAGGHKTLVPELIEALRQGGRDDILVVAGGVIPDQDIPLLLEQGVSAVFGPGTVIPEAAHDLLSTLLEQLPRSSEGASQGKP